MTEVLLQLVAGLLAIALAGCLVLLVRMRRALRQARAANSGLREARSEGTGAHVDSRCAVIRDQAAQAGGSHRVILLGDSICERSDLRELGGVPVLNAGIGGMDLATAIWIVAPVVAAVPAAQVLVALGCNNAVRGSGRTEPELLATFEAEYVTLLSVLSARGTDRLATLAICQVAAQGELGNVYLDPVLIDGFNLIIRRLSRESGIQYIWLDDRMRGSDGRMPMRLTLDGVHLSPAGYALWHESLQAGARQW